MKENLKVLNIDGETEWREVKSLFSSLGFSSVISGLTFMFTDKHGLPCRDITLPELRELAKPREYLDENFKLVVTNQPKEGYRLVPDGAEYYSKTKNLELASWFYKVENSKLYFWGFDGWCVSGFTDEKSFKKILRQRTPQQETIMKKKGRFLHHWAYEAFGRGEDVQITAIAGSPYFDVGFHHSLSDFNDPQFSFRLKPQTIQIGSRTINKPISVKPEMGTEYFVVALYAKTKYGTEKWTDHEMDNLFLERGLIHLKKEDAINHTDALLELMK